MSSRWGLWGKGRLWHRSEMMSIKPCCKFARQCQKPVLVPPVLLNSQCKERSEWGLGGEKYDLKQILREKSHVGTIPLLPTSPSTFSWQVIGVIINSWWKWLILKYNKTEIHLTDLRPGMKTPLFNNLAWFSANAVDGSALLWMGTSEACKGNRSMVTWCSETATVSNQDGVGRAADTIGPRDGWPAQPCTHSFLQPLRQGWALGSSERMKKW